MAIKGVCMCTVFYSCSVVLNKSQDSKTENCSVCRIIIILCYFTYIINCYHKLNLVTLLKLYTYLRINCKVACTVFWLLRYKVVQQTLVLLPVKSSENDKNVKTNKSKRASDNLRPTVKGPEISSLMFSKMNI